MKSVAELPGAGVAVTSLVLRQVRFERLPAGEHEAAKSTEPEPNVPLSIGFQIGIGRPSRYTLNVELEAHISAPPHAEMWIAYVVQFAREVLDETEEAASRYWRDVVSQVAPVVIYPYLRETVASLTSKAGLNPITLPILNFKTVIDPATIVIPQPAEPALFDQPAKKPA